MRKMFFDTWGWVAIAHRYDSHHAEAVSFYKVFLQKKGIPVTTDYILAETITLLRARTDPEGTTVFIEATLDAARGGRILIERMDEKRWQKAWEMSKKYKDKPNISFVDFTSFIIMKELSVSEVLTSDKHFEDVGLGFKKLF
jgi:predicted nucleic acid-binding protein